jgi:hypothetical protein
MIFMLIINISTSLKHKKGKRMSVETMPYTNHESKPDEDPKVSPDANEPKWPEHEPTETEDNPSTGTSTEATVEINPETEEKPETAETARSKVVEAANERVANFVEDHGEKIEAAKKATRRFGKWALRHAKSGGRVGFGLTLLSLEGVAKGTGFLAAKVITAAAQAKSNWAKRREERKLKREASARNKRYEQEAEAERMNEAFDSKTRAKARHDKKVAEAENEAYSMNQHYDAHAEADSLNKNYDEHVEAWDMNKEFDEKIRQERLEADRRAKAARAAKEIRKARRTAERRDMYRNGIELGANVIRGIGRTGLRAFKSMKRSLKRVGSAVSAGAKAAAADWKK